MAGPLRRRPLRAALAGLLVAVFALIGALLYSAAGHKVAVLAVRTPVQRGQVIRAHDLVVARISRSAFLRPLAANDEGGVVGHRAAVGLVPGELLTAGALATGPPIGGQQAEVGLSLRPTELPQGLLEAGDPVEVVSTRGRTATAASLGLPPGTVLATATVAAPPAPSSSSGDTELRLIVSRAAAPAVATGSAAGQVAVVALPGQGRP